MDDDIRNFLNKVGIPFENVEDLNYQLIPRELLLDKNVYKSVYDEIPILKNYLKSSNCTCLHSNAESTQRWPLLNIIRQILRNYNYKMEPIRKAEGYTEDGKKIYKRYFLICKLTDKDCEKANKAVAYDENNE
tara:strand:- start:2948 stop:3346 length:399 start_codon:yes stop_codon:yes gene_type:complete